MATYDSGYGEEDLRRVHRKFIPGNIIILLVSLLAAVCMILMPYLDIRIKADSDLLTPMLKEAVGNEEDDTQKLLESALENLDVTVPINLRPLKMLSAATGDDEDLEAFFNSLIGTDGTAELVDELLKEITPAVLTVGITKSLIEAENLTDEQIASINNRSQELSAVLDKLSDGQDAAAQAQFKETAKGLAEDLGTTLSDEEADEFFEKFKDMGKTADGDFTMTEFIKNLDMEKLKSEEGDAAPASVRLTAASESSSSSEDSDLSAIVEILENPGKAILEKLNEKGHSNEEIQKVVLVAFLVLIAFPTLLWTILALSALLHLFTAKKKACMWYVKLFCPWLGIIVLALNVGVKFLPKLVPSMPALSVTVLGAGVVTGACWLVLVLLSLFYYNRVKRQVRKMKKGLEE